MTTVDLRWRFEAGQGYRYRIAYESYPADGRFHAEAITFWFRILSVDLGGAAIVEAKYDDLVLKVGGELEYDSSRDERPQEGFKRVLAGLLGKRFQFRMLPSGRITAVMGLEGIRSHLLARAAGLAESMPRKNLEDAFSGRWMERRLQDAFPCLPDVAVGLGDEWDVEKPWGSVRGKVEEMGKYETRVRHRRMDQRGSGKIRIDSEYRFDHTRGVLVAYHEERTEEGRGPRIQDSFDVKLLASLSAERETSIR